MKHYRYILPAFCLSMMASGLTSSPLIETFDYANGSGLVGQGSWVFAGGGGGSGENNPIINNGTFSMGPGGVDPHLPVPFTAGSGSPGNSVLWQTYAGFDLNISAAGVGDFFFGFGGNQGDLRAKLWVMDSGTGYALGYSSGSTGTPTYSATILDYDETYRIVFRYDMIPGSGNNTGLFYIDPTDSVEANNTAALDLVEWSGGSDFGSGFDGVVFRQNTDGPNVSAIGNLIIANNDFASAAAIPEPATYAAIAGLFVCGVAILRRRRR